MHLEKQNKTKMLFSKKKKKKKQRLILPKLMVQRKNKTKKTITPSIASIFFPQKKNEDFSNYTYQL